ncbi:hypothetical protein ZIOFF_035619 [Zingiber officinale]|uniref:Serine-threonine/tyrosine-protein kinase catalytic domain-containing protein n=1 Tax=Zingiber officinale TaxID=94328 RepID=A0A8J5GKR5_ZINOF|nr:hypothetical protein ZIOFF_035619 [Zingiber officinale]
MCAAHHRCLLAGTQAPLTSTGANLPFCPGTGCHHYACRRRRHLSTPASAFSTSCPRFLLAAGSKQDSSEVEVEAIGKVRHKNLVGLIGYCAEGAERMLLYEYIDNDTLEQWLHGDIGPIPLTWDIRMKMTMEQQKGCYVAQFAAMLLLNLHALAIEEALSSCMSTKVTPSANSER